MKLAALTRSRTVAIAAGAAIAAGLIASAFGRQAIADACWAAITIAALVPLAASTIAALRKGRAGVDVIALLAMAGALLLGHYLAGAVIALMLSSGRALEDFAEKRARRELSALIARAPRSVHRVEGGNVSTHPIETVRAGDHLMVKPGEVVPVDGIVQAPAVLDESALTGESMPVDRRPGEAVRSGSLNVSARPFELCATATAAESTYGAIIRLVEEAQASKAPLARLADRYALLFLPATLVVAGAAWAFSGDPVRALAVLVIATPCPLILAAPVAIVGGISRAARRGVIVKGGAALETLARADVLILDKTGTVTAGSPVVTEVLSCSPWDARELLRMAASLDQVSGHVLAAPILRAAAERGLELRKPEGAHEEFGSGIRGRVEGREVALGSAEWVLRGGQPPSWLRSLRKRASIERSPDVLVAVDGELAGVICLEDPIRSDAPMMIRSLRADGFRAIVLLTGDREAAAKSVGAVLGVDRVLAECSPGRKLEAVEAASAEGITVMVGDGINDAPALAAADVGVAMGARGASAASEAADVVLLVDRVDRLIEATRTARRSRRIAIQSILAGMGLSAAGMGFAAFGFLPPVTGAVLQEVIDALVVLNALRALGPRRNAAAISPPECDIGRRVRSEHRQLLPRVKEIRALADRLDAECPRDELLALHTFLVHELLPHQEAEDALLYPVVAKLMGGDDPTGTMTRAHAEIAALVAALGRYLEDGGPAPEDVREVRRILYALDAIVRLHFVQEEEAYLARIESQSETDFELPKSA